VSDITREARGESVIWARSAYAGSQRYPVHWSGDNSSNFENLLCSLRGGLSLGMCGFTFWSQDTGGWCGVPTDVLYIRWTQLSIFQSHLRYHGTAPLFREPWNFGQEAQAIVRDYLELRYRLIPYLYGESRIAADSGLPLLRPLVLEFQNDPSVRHIEDEFMCGRCILVAPVMTGRNERDLYLPAGDWYDFWTGEMLTGPRWLHRECSLDMIPVYVRAGTVLPLGPVVQCTSAMGNDEYTLRIFPEAGGTASYNLLEGEGSVKIDARWRGGAVKLTIKPRPRVIRVEVPLPVRCTGVSVNGKAMRRFRKGKGKSGYAEISDR
jgi:alpha-D-xyloside xylohydrolase